jgi:hypothetical protein
MAYSSKISTSSFQAPIGAIDVATIDEEAIEKLELSAHAPKIDEALLRVSPARDIRRYTDAMVSLLETVDLTKLLRRQGLIGRLTGADVEARLEFELSSHKVLQAFQQVSRAAKEGIRLKGLMADAQHHLEEEIIRISKVIEDATLRLSRSKNADLTLTARFERRLANITALDTANRMAVEQFKLSRNILVALIDRVADVETLLLPLWKQNALAIIHGETLPARNAAMQIFIDTHQALLGLLKKVGNE